MKQIAACVPVDMAPDFPDHAPYSVYEQVKCPNCKLPMWLGARCKVLVERGEAEMLCTLCAVMLNPDAQHAMLTDRDN